MHLCTVCAEGQPEDGSLIPLVRPQFLFTPFSLLFFCLSVCLSVSTFGSCNVVIYL